jgi:hypothetical protein
MCLSVEAATARGNKKTHSRFQPWVLVKASVQQAPTASLTTTTSIITCELFFNIQSYGNISAAKGQALIGCLIF